MDMDLRTDLPRKHEPRNVERSRVSGQISGQQVKPLKHFALPMNLGLSSPGGGLPVCLWLQSNEPRHKVRYMAQAAVVGVAANEAFIVHVDDVGSLGSWFQWILSFKCAPSER